MKELSNQSATSCSWESYTWKNELHLHAERVEIYLNEILEEDFVGQHNPMHMLERALVLSAFCIRRMVEKRLVTDILAASRIPVRTYLSSSSYRPPFIGSSGTSYTIFENYSLGTPVLEHLKVGEIANEIIHSSQLLVFDGADLEPKSGLFVASDYRMTKRLLHLEIDEYRSWVDSVLNDRIGISSDNWDPETGEVTATRESL